MESYPPYLLNHVSPLVTIQGLGTNPTDFHVQEAPESIGELLIRKQAQLNPHDHVLDLIKIWRKFHIDGVFWSSSATKTQLPTHPHRYKFKFIDNEHQLPTFKQDEVSPMTDEILPSDWFHKFQSHIPSIFIAFYEVDEDISKDEELIEEINALKEQLQIRNIKLLAILTTSRIISIEQKIENIRKSTGLNNRNGLLVLPPDFKPKELNTFALEVLQIIKLASSEFYATIDKKLRKERMKVISQVTVDGPGKNAIEVKYCLKVAFINELKGNYDQSSKHYETAYENFIDIFNNGYPVTDPNWSHFRQFLDVIVFHIVRLNFYLEYPNVAYRKFDIHLKSVTYFLRNDSISVESSSFYRWLSFQFKWLAQLSDLAPTSLVPSDYPFKFDVTVSNRLNPLLLPHPGYLFLQVADFWRKTQTAEIDDRDPYKLQKEEESTEVLINLLTFAKLAFQKRDNSFNRTIASINYQIGEEYFETKNFEKAFKFFEQALDSVKEDDWSYLMSFIHYRLFQCSKELKKVYGSVLNILELALVPQNSVDSNILSTIKKETSDDSGLKQFLTENEEILVINAATDSSFDLFESKVLFKDTEISISKGTSIQLSLTSKLNSILPGVVLDDLLITFNGDSFPRVLLKHDPNSSVAKNSLIQIKDLKLDEDAYTLSANVDLRFDPLEEKIFQLDLPPTKHIGFNEITSLTSILDYNSFFKVKLNIPVSSNPFQRRHVWHLGEDKTKIITSMNPASVNVIPRVPETIVDLKNIPKSACVGETLVLDLYVIDKDEEKVELDVVAEFSNESVTYKWNDVKSETDGPLKVKELIKNENTQHKLYLFIPQNYKVVEHKDLSIRLKLTYYINGDHEVPSFKILNYSLPIIDPFKINLSIQPRLKESDLQEDMSQLNVEEATEAIPNPKPSRYWLFRLNTFIDLKADLEIVDEKLTIKSENDKIGCSEVSSLQRRDVVDNKAVSSHYLDTEILDGHTHRNVVLEVSFEFNYKRSGSDIVSTYVNEPWKLTLPLLDPRVLLSIKEEGKELELTFMLENPTSKVFSFSTTLLDNRHFTVLSGTKQLPNVSVEPLKRQILKFRVALNTDTKDTAPAWHQLPQLRVYDVNYRVNLPTLVVTEAQTQTHKGDIYVLI